LARPCFRQRSTVLAVEPERPFDFGCPDQMPQFREPSGPIQNAKQDAAWGNSPSSALTGRVQPVSGTRPPPCHQQSFIDCKNTCHKRRVYDPFHAILKNGEGKEDRRQALIAFLISSGPAHSSRSGRLLPVRSKVGASERRRLRALHHSIHCGRRDQSEERHRGAGSLPKVTTCRVTRSPQRRRPAGPPRPQPAKLQRRIARSRPTTRRVTRSPQRRRPAGRPRPQPAKLQRRIARSRPTTRRVTRSPQRRGRVQRPR